MNSTSQTNINWMETLTGQALMFSVLAKLIYQSPDKTWLDALIAEDIFAEAPFAGVQPDVVTGLGLLQAWSQAHRGGISPEAFAEMSVDHTRLFLGPGKV